MTERSEVPTPTAQPIDGESAAHALTEHLPIPLLLLDGNSNIVFANVAATELFTPADQAGEGFRLAGPIGRYLHTGVAQVLKALVTYDVGPHAVQLIAGTKLIEAELRVGASEFQGLRWRAVTIQPVDQTSALLESSLVLKALDYAALGVIISDAHDHIVAANDLALHLLSASRAELIGTGMIPRLLGPSKADELQAVRDDLADTGVWQGLLRADGETADDREIRVAISTNDTFAGSGDERKPRSFHVAIISDITHATEAKRKLGEQAERDTLTSLLNRAGFMRAYRERFAEVQRTGESLALLYIDLDNFKYLNDNYGHYYGDLLLHAFAGRLRSGVKRSDTVARLGGDEFVLMFDGEESVGSLSHNVDRLRRRLVQPYHLEDMQYTCAASFGSARYPSDAGNPEELLVKADRAMFSAKSLGKNSYVAFSTDIASDVTPRDSLVDQVHQALRDNRIVPYYQPQFDLQTGSMIGAEVLVRWLDANGTVERLPGAFLPAIASHPVFISLGIKLITQVFAQLGSLFLPQGPFPVCVNLSPMQLRSEDVVKHLEEMALRFPDHAASVAVEITETSFFERDPIVLANIDRIEAAGFTFILDDFGTGHASILSLRAHRFSLVKIDKAFVDALDSGDDTDLRLLESMISLIAGLRLPILCEGIEHERQLETVRSLGCDYGQGFNYAKPMSKIAFTQFLRGRAHPVVHSGY